jgi:hypothetical protein
METVTIPRYARWSGQFSHEVNQVGFLLPSGVEECRPAFNPQPASFIYDPHGMEHFAIGDQKSVNEMRFGLMVSING